MMNSSEMKIGRLAGFDLYIQPLGLVLLLLFSVSMSQDILSGVFFLVALLFAVTIHELGHAYVARRRGMWVQKIVLHAFGGVTYWSGRAATGPSGWKDRIWITAAGPAVNLVVGAIAYGLLLLLSGMLPLVALILLSSLFYLNIVLGLFNLLPIYPLDGGMLLHTVMTGKWGTRRASLAYLIGMGGAALLSLLGILSRSPIMAVFGALFVFQNYQKWKEESPPGGFKALRAEWESQREREWLRRHRSEVDAALRQSLEQGIQSLSSQQKDLLRRARRYDQWRN
jgi:Zn-dependent protease